MEIFHHNTSGGLFPTLEAAEGVNENDENEDIFSILDQIENFRKINGLFHFRLCYPELDHRCNEWTQSSNPITDSEIQNFTAISNQFETNARRSVPFQGLGLNTDHSNKTLLDTQPNSTAWWYAVGATMYSPYHPGKIPGPKNEFVTQVVLYVKKGK